MHYSTQNRFNFDIDFFEVAVHTCLTPLTTRPYISADEMEAIAVITIVVNLDIKKWEPNPCTLPLPYGSLSRSGEGLGPRCL